MTIIDSLISELRKKNVGLWIHNNDLGIDAPKGALSAKDIEVLRAHKNAIIEFVRRTEDSKEISPINLIDRHQSLPMSLAQQRLWFIDQLEGAGAAYHIASAVRLRGALDRSALRGALDTLVGRHETLRTSFVQVDGTAVQVIAEQGSFALQEIDISNLAPEEREAAVQRHAAEEAQAPFNLSTGPLIRGRLIRVTEDEHALLVTMHHIVSDGWSMGVLIRELGVLYTAYREGRPNPLAPLPIQYADYAQWQREWLQGEQFERQAKYWKSALEGVPALLELPTDHLRPAAQSYAGANHKVILDADLSRGLKALSQKHGTTLFMTLMASWAALLSRLSGQDDVVIGTPVANRTRTEIEGLIGFFVNTQALRIDLSGSPTVGELLTRVKGQALAAQSHPDIPFEQVVEIVNPARSLAHSPIFQVLFTWQNAPTGALNLPGLQLVPLQMPRITAKFDLSLSLGEMGDQIGGVLEYATALFDRSTITRYLGYWQALLKGMVADDQQQVDRLAFIGADELNRILVEWNDTAAEYPKDKCVHELFEEQVARTPDAIAVIYEDQQITYAELNQRANKVVQLLVQREVRVGENIAAMFDRSIDLIVAELAVLKCGCAYVPLSHDLPIERLRFMMADCGVRFLLCAETAEIPKQISVQQIPMNGLQWPGVDDCNVSSKVSSENTAYIMYTSGSTGLPKGVMIPHRAISRLVLNNGYLKFSENDRVAFASNPCFDASTFEVWGPLLSGGSVVVIDEDTLFVADAFSAVLLRHSVTVLWLTVGLFNQYAESLTKVFSRLRCILVGGDALNCRVISNVLRAGKPHFLMNGYGPTETTTFASTFVIESLSGTSRSVPIGRPISNTQIYILDSHMQPVPVGVTGEIYIGGAGVALGYINRPDLTAERFLSSPFDNAHDRKIYKTGDLGRWMFDGNIEYVGRNDYQAKVRGFRVELGEIEVQLKNCQGVKDAVALTREDATGEKQLVAYVVPSTGVSFSSEDLRVKLEATLPKYMVPSALVLLSALPLTSNGKVDRADLAARHVSAQTHTRFIPPGNAIEKTLAAIWSDVLKVDRVGIHDNFFELGGHSLIAMKIIVRIKQAFGIELPVRIIFESPTVERLGEHVAARCHHLMPDAPGAEEAEETGVV